MQDQLVIVVSGIVLAFILLVIMLASYYQPFGSDDDDEDDDDTSSGDMPSLKINLDDGHGGSGGGGGGGSGGGGGGGALSGNQRIKNNLQATFVSDKEQADYKIYRGGSGGYGQRKHDEATTITAKHNRQCSHCGAVQSEDASTCWNCGSKPGSTFGPGGLDRINRDLRKEAVESHSQWVKKTDEPIPNSVDPPATMDDGEETHATDEDYNIPEKTPLHRLYIGLILGWVQKWKHLIGTHLSSMLIVTSIAATIWGLTIVYGTIAFDSTGLISLIAASVVAVTSASLAVLFFLSPGRVKTITLAYPFSLNVVLLPPIVIAIHEPRLSMLLDLSVLVAEFILVTYAAVLGVETWLRATFSLEGTYFILMWFIISIPLGWTLGTAVYLTKVLWKTYNKYVDKITDIISQSGDSTDGRPADDQQPTEAPTTNQD